MLSRLISILVLCISYAVLGRLALLLAIPPGYATAIFPSAGIAVAALLIWGNRLWPGVFFGSVLLNVWVSIELAPLTLSGFGVAVAAATGAVLQAWAGAWLVRRVIGFPAALDKERDIFLFMLLAGPVACLINASFGATSLLATGFISGHDYVNSWITWWVGDLFGVTIIVPLMFIAFARPRSLWWGRRTSIALPLMIVLAAVIILFLWVSKWELERTQFDFRSVASDVVDEFKASFENYLQMVVSIERFYASSSNVTRDDFHSFVKYMVLKPGIKGLSWNPVIKHDQRDDFEKMIRGEGFDNFQIKERDAKGNIIQAANRDQYVVVHYIEPMQGNEAAFGFDVASNAERLKALNQARDSGQYVATERITLVQDNGNQAGFLLFQPVYDGAHNTQQERRENITGFIVGVFRVGDIIKEVLEQTDDIKIVVGIYDQTVADYQHLYGPESRNLFSSAIVQLNASLEIAGRHWLISIMPSEWYLANHYGWQAWFILAVGLMFITLLSAFLLAMTGRSFLITRLVDRRTAELSGILSTAIEAIITTDANGIIESINPAGERLFGYRRADIIGASVCNIIPEFFSQSDIEKDRENVSLSSGNRRDSYAIRKDQERISIELAISVLKVIDRTLYTAIIHDLTERTKINQMKDEFISTVSHELRTPLTSIKGVVGLLLGGALDNDMEKKKSMIEVSYKNIGHLEMLINDLLDINKFQSAGDRLQLTTIRINDLIDKAIRANQGYAEKYNVSYQWQPIDEHNVYINVDEVKLMQVLFNLLSNAVKYSPKQAKVIISTHLNGDEIRVSISDTGPGIPLAFQDKVFDRFTQADSSDTRRAGGTGLGMAITKLIVEKHGGCIGFDSTPGQGTTFYFVLSIVK